MSSLFASLLGVANQRQEGEMQGQQTLRQIVAQQQATALAQRKESFLEKLQQAQAGEADAKTRKLQSEIENPQGSFEPVTAGDATGNNVVYRFDKKTGQIQPTGVSGKIPTPPRDPTPHFTIQNVTGADGKIHLARVNSLTGEVTELPNLGKQPTGHGGAGGVMQQMVQQHYQSAKQADDRLNRFGGTITSHGQISNYIMGHNPLDSDLQQANQAGEEFATLIAPLVNRGRTTHIELDQIKKSYVPLASDSKETIAQKAASRKALLDAFAKEAGDAGGVVSPATAPGASAHPLKAKYGLE